MNSLTVIDFHSHILPALDHGCEKIEECRGQLELMSDCGTHIAVATSHFYPHMHNIGVFADKVDAAVGRIQASSMTKAPTLCVGAEVLLYAGLNNMEDLERLCIKGTKLLLIELPNSDINDAHIETLEGMLRDGYGIILAHIDRYLSKHAEEIDYILSLGAVAQVNAYSLASKSTRKKILHYLETTDKICALGSDLHGVDAKNYKKFVKAQKILSDYYSEIMRRSGELLKDAERFNVIK